MHVLPDAGHLQNDCHLLLQNHVMALSSYLHDHKADVC